VGISKGKAAMAAMFGHATTAISCMWKPEILYTKHGYRKGCNVGTTPCPKQVFHESKCSRVIWQTDLRIKCQPKLSKAHYIFSAENWVTFLKGKFRHIYSQFAENRNYKAFSHMLFNMHKPPQTLSCYIQVLVFMSILYNINKSPSKAM
jgi:hypothetical protein